MRLKGQHAESHNKRTMRRLILFVLALAVAGCASATAPPVAEHGPQASGAAASSGVIKHVVVIVQENRTLDNLFHGFPGADTAQSGLDHLGNVHTLVPEPLEGPGDWGHGWPYCQTAVDGGKMDGFDLVKQVGAPPTNYSYVQQSDIGPYWTLAQRYTLADRFFGSNCGSSFPAHQYLIAGQSGSPNTPKKAPWGCDSPLVKPPCFDYQTLGDLLDAAGVGWRYYAHGVAYNNYASLSGFLAYDAIKHIRYGADWSPSHIGVPETTFLSDVQSGQLQPVSWVTPTCSNSDNHGCTGGAGPSWVSAVVNAVGESPYWNDTAIFLVWDDWGGWYDHVPPQQLDKWGLGPRVPLVVISPYAKVGYVSHVNHEFGSILKFTEETFGLGSLGTADARADDLMDCFDFTQSPTPYLPLAAPRTYLKGLSDDRPPDDDANDPEP